MGSPVIRGLRLKGNELQLTRVLAALFKTEPLAAPGLKRFPEQVPREHGRNRLF
jgi:hypothetical protein